MMFLSHAQNFEDVILWRALGTLPAGRYLDIGAQHPVVDSVSRSFYEHGWRGTHVEPSAHYAGLLREDRPDEHVLQVALGQDEGQLTFHEFPDTGLSTLDATIAARHVADGFACVPVKVPVLTLDQVLGDLEAEPHWMKIDVEGAERQVLQGWKHSPLRPWVVVVESTLPRQPQQSYEDWEPLLLAKGYRFAYFDGLNRFYVSAEHPELAAQLAIPPNVFDQFAFSRRTTPIFCQDLQQERDQLAQDIQNLRSSLNEQQAQLARTQNQLDTTRSTVSARTTQLRTMLRDQRPLEKQRSDLQKALHEIQNSRQYLWMQRLDRAVQRLRKLQPQWLQRKHSHSTEVTPQEAQTKSVLIRFDGWNVLFDEGALVDTRGIGRVSHEILGEMLRLAPHPTQTEALSPPVPEVHFYSSIHWCPAQLPHPSVVLIHDVIPLLLSEHFDASTVNHWREHYAAIARQADRIVTISHASARDISRELGIDESRISVIYNGITHLQPDSGTSVIVPEHPYFVYLGSFDHHKNLTVVLQALSTPACREMHLVLIGKNDNCKDLVLELGLENQVHFVGSLGDAEAANVIQHAVAMVFPSLYEGFGLPPLEAALLGTPSICSRRPAMTETLHEAALFADPANVEEWVQALETLWTSPDVRQQLGSAARARAHAYDWQDSVTELLGLLQQCALEHPPAATPTTP